MGGFINFCFIFNSFIKALLKCNKFTKCTVNFGNCIQSHNFYPNQDTEYFHHLENFICATVCPQSAVSNPQSLTSTNLFSVTIILPFLEFHTN